MSPKAVSSCAPAKRTADAAEGRAAKWPRREVRSGQESVVSGEMGWELQAKDSVLSTYSSK